MPPPRETQRPPRLTPRRPCRSKPTATKAAAQPCGKVLFFFLESILSPPVFFSADRNGLPPLPTFSIIQKSVTKSNPQLSAIEGNFPTQARLIYIFLNIYGFFHLFPMEVSPPSGKQGNSSLFCDISVKGRFYLPPPYGKTIEFPQSIGEQEGIVSWRAPWQKSNRKQKIYE